MLQNLNFGRTKTRICTINKFQHKNKKIKAISFILKKSLLTVWQKLFCRISTDLNINYHKNVKNTATGSREEIWVEFVYYKANFFFSALVTKMTTKTNKYK